MVQLLCRLNYSLTNVKMDTTLNSIKVEPEDGTEQNDDTNNEKGVLGPVKTESNELLNTLEIVNVKPEFNVDNLIKNECIKVEPLHDYESENFQYESIVINNSTNDKTLRKYNKRFKTKLKQTAKKRSKIKAKTQGTEVLYKCTECHFSAKAKRCLTLHIRIHTGEKPYPCHLCPYEAKRKSHLDLHLKVHKGERPFSCPTCSKCFITKQDMKEHARIHSDEKPYQCYHCNYRSKHKSCIAYHIRRKHANGIELPETHSCICYVCGKYFSLSASLRVHLKSHTEEKTHLCELCGRYFRKKDMLKNHLLTHTREKPFKCQTCDYMTNRKALLQDHMKSHIRHPELVECASCGKRYTTKLLLKHHVLEEHTEKE